jgi:mono/diheme cytochrome c family protein
MTIAYPMVIGGKPYFAFPAFVPVTFEVTVLLATLATVIGMITFFYQFPHNAHPLHDTDYMAKVSNDKFGVCIEAADPKFDEAEVKSLYEELGGRDIESVYELAKVEQNTFNPRFIMLLAAVAVIVSGGTYLSLNKAMFMVPYDWMMNQPRLDAQERSEFFADEYGMRPPVEGTVARNTMPYLYDGMKNQQPDEPLINPYFPTTENIALGKERFDIYCSPCHGFRGEGDSRLRGQFSVPPSLHSEKAFNWSDGDFYHVLMVGQNVMPSYASQLEEHERWAVINYIRVLQKAMNPTEEEIQMAKEESASK